MQQVVSTDGRGGDDADSSGMLSVHAQTYFDR